MKSTFPGSILIHFFKSSFVSTVFTILYRTEYLFRFLIDNFLCDGYLLLPRPTARHHHLGHGVPQRVSQASHTQGQEDP